MGWYSTLALLTAAVAAAAVLTPLPEGVLGFEPKTSMLLRLSYVSGFAVSFGTSVWVTFVAGVVLFRSLPRHQFGEVQSKLFPPYFRLVAASASIALGSFAVLHPLKSSATLEKSQFGALAVPVLGALLNLLLLEPITSKVMRERHRIEKEAGIGTEVGLSKNREVAKTNPKLREINKKFGMVHGFSSLANLVGLIGLVVHLYYLAGKIQV